MMLRLFPMPNESRFLVVWRSPRPTLLFLLLSLTGCHSSSETTELSAQPDVSDSVVISPADPGRLQRELASATALVNAGAVAAAGTILRPLLIEHPDNATVLFLLARCQAIQGNLDEAVGILELIPSTHPDAGLPALGMSADWLIQLRRFDDAEVKLRTILGLQDRSIVAHRRLAQLLNGQGRRAQAMPHMRALARFRVATASELYGMNLLRDPFVHTDETGTVELPLSELCEAKLQWFEGRLAEAKLMAMKLLEKSATSPAEVAFAGRVFSMLQDDELLASWIRKLPPGIEREPEYWFALGEWHQRLAEHRVAVRCFAEAVELDDTDRFSYLGLARSLAAIGQSELSDSANQRYELLAEANYIVVGVERTPEQLKRLTSILHELHRPDEAYGWSLLLSDSIEKPRQEPNELNPSLSKGPWLTCGVVTSDWPLPEIAALVSRKDSPRPVATASEATISLSDIAGDVQLDFQYRPGVSDDVEQLRMFQITGAGVAVLDYDRDGWPDLYFGQGGSEIFSGDEGEPNQLFRNLRAERFQNTTLPSYSGDRGYAQGIAAADVDQDGFSDLVVANIGPNVVLRNNGDGTFTRRLLGESEPEAWSSSIACGDLDGDHVPEIVIVNYINDPRVQEMPCSGRDGASCSPQRFIAATNEILQLGEEGAWHPWPPSSNPWRPTYGLGVLMTNVDGQHGNDLYLANDTEPNSLLLSEPRGEAPYSFGLTESAQIRGCAVGLRGNSEGSMGIAAGDYNRDGKLDLHVTNFANEPSALYVQHEHGIFVNQYLGQRLGESTTAMVGWGTQSNDFDNDGWMDLAVMNGHLYPSLGDGSTYRMRPQMFRGDAHGFTLLSPASQTYWDTPRLGRALASLDWNRDGKRDLVSVHLDAPVALLQNDSRAENWIQLELSGTTSERDAIGARVSVETVQQTWTQWVTSGDGYQCGNEHVVSIGVGGETGIVKLVVQWPSGSTSSFENVGTNRCYLCIENEVKLVDRAATD